MFTRNEPVSSNALDNRTAATRYSFCGVTAPGEGSELEGVEDAIDEGLLLAELHLNEVLARATADLPRQEAIREWLFVVVQRALSLRAQSARRSVEDGYWDLHGGRPQSGETIRADLMAELDSLDGVSPEWTNFLKSVEFRDRSGEAGDILRQGLLLIAAQSHFDGLNEEVGRILELHDLAVSQPLPDSVDHYLRRIARLYAVGYDLDMAVLARSALEAALKDAVPESAAREVLVLSRTGGVTLENLIDAAALRGALSHHGRLYAHALRKFGNKALHADPPQWEPVGGPFGVLMRLCFCLREIGSFQPEIPGNR